MPKLSLIQKLQNLGYKEFCYKTYIKDLEYNTRIKQVIKVDLFDDHKLDECYVEALIRIKKKDIQYVNIAVNRVESDFEKLKKEIEQDES